MLVWTKPQKKQLPGKRGANELYRASQVALPVQPGSSPNWQLFPYWLYSPFQTPFPQHGSDWFFHISAKPSLFFFSGPPRLRTCTCPALKWQIPKRGRANIPAKRSATGGYVHSKDIFKVLMCMRVLLHISSQSPGGFPGQNSHNHALLLSCASALLCFKENCDI